MTKRILILGGGFGGVSVARALVRELRGQGRLREPGSAAAPALDDVDVTLINRENYFVFQPLLSDVLPATLPPTHGVVPLRRMLSGVDVQVATVEDVDTHRGAVGVRRRHDGARLEMPYDHLVVALGSVTDFRAVPGMSEHAVGLRTLGDTIYLRNRALAMLEAADLEHDAERRERLLTFVVVGGGSTGVEVAAELWDLVRNAARSFREADLRPRVVLVHSRRRLLPAFPASLGRYATRTMRRIGVELALERRLTRVTADGVELDDGTFVGAETVVSTVGNAPHPLLSSFGASLTPDGWLRTDSALAVPGHDNVWALGDCASVPHPSSGVPAPATAQHAVRQGPRVATNILRAMAGKTLEPYEYHSKGALVSLGTLRGVGTVLGVPVKGPIAWLAWRSYYLSQLPTLERRVRVVVDWLLELVLPPDIVQVDVRRSTTSRVVDDAPSDVRLELPSQR